MQLLYIINYQIREISIFDTISRTTMMHFCVNTARGTQEFDQIPYMMVNHLAAQKKREGLTQLKAPKTRLPVKDGVYWDLSIISRELALSASKHWETIDVKKRQCTKFQVNCQQNNTKRDYTDMLARDRANFIMQFVM